MLRLALATALAIVALPLGARTPLPLPEVVAAELILPTDRYDHAVLGDALEWAGLLLTVDTCPPCADRRLDTVRITLPPDRVFEDVVARVVDVTGDGLAEVVVVEADAARGAALVVYDANGGRVATPWIGQRHRWLAPAAVGDFDGDGRPEIAYVDRPHLARELVFVRLDGERLVEVARAPGFSNHRIGEATITGALRRCGGVDEVILPDAGWGRVMAARIADGRVVARDAGRYRGPDSIARAAGC